MALFQRSFKMSLPPCAFAVSSPFIAISCIFAMTFRSYHHRHHNHLMSVELKPPIFPSRNVTSQREVTFRFENASAHLISTSLNASFAEAVSTFTKHVVIDYHYWHARQLRQHSNKTKLFVARLDKSPTHGLGDRLRGTITAYFLSVLTRRVLLIDWRLPIPLSLVLSPSPTSGITNFTYDSHFDAVSSRITISGNLYHTENLYINYTTVYLDSVPRPNVTRWFRPPPRRAHSSRLLQNLSSISHALPPCVAIPLVLQALFTPTKLVREHIARRAPAVLLNSRVVYTGVHARLGYGLDEAAKDAARFDLTRRSGISSLWDIAICFSRRIDVKTKIVFLATDTPKFRPLFIDAVKMFVPDVKVVFLKDASVKHVRDLNDSTQEDRDVFLDTFTELYLLSQAQVLYNMRSGFADLAAWMGVNCRQNIITYDECAAQLPQNYQNKLWFQV